ICNYVFPITITTPPVPQYPSAFPYRSLFRSVDMVVGVDHLRPAVVEFHGEDRGDPLGRRLVFPGRRVGGGVAPVVDQVDQRAAVDRKSTRLNSSHVKISYAVFCLKKKTIIRL